MATLHQSDLTAWSRCPAAFNFERQGRPRRQSSALVYGSVVHHAMEVFERLRHTGGSHQEAVKAAVDTFVHYWNPMHVEEICERPVDLWLPYQSYSSLRARGQKAIQEYCQLIRHDDHELLATEFGFQVPIEGTWDEDLGEPHILAGTIDRLAVRHYAGHMTVCVDDYKCCEVGTPVLMADGSERPVEEVAVGDLVAGWRDGRIVAAPVEGSRDNLAQQCVRVRSTYGDLVVTNDHPFLVGTQWMKAGELQPGDLLTVGLGKAVTTPVHSVESVGERNTWALTVEGGVHITGGVVTHNTGKEQRYLRQNLQFSAYCYATTRPEFWLGWRGEDGFGAERGHSLLDRFAAAPRRGTWINLKKIAFTDAGWRGPEDYRRLGIAADQLVASMKADIYPLSLSGETCEFCDFRDICTGNGVPAKNHGAPIH